MRMRFFLAAAVIVLLAGSAYAQAAVPKYREGSKDKSQQEIQSERDAEKAYKRSLGNIPDQGPTDPWGNVRSDSTPKPVVKAAPAKKTKTGNAN
jgi:hypothetical protein